MFDTHAHLADPQLEDQIDDVIGRAIQVGLEGILAVGTDLRSSLATIQLAERFPIVWAAVGIHPNHSHEAADGDWEQIVRLAEHERVVAIGETGLDRHWDFCPWDVQTDYFARHIQLSQQTGKPLVIHQRDCQSEMLDTLRTAATNELSGIMHSFTGDSVGAREFLTFGLQISFAGMLTYKKSDALRAVAKEIPADRLLVETDSPYLSPEPVRSQRVNEPRNVRHTVDMLAEVRGVTPEEIEQVTTRNARRVFGLSDR